MLHRDLPNQADYGNPYHNDAGAGLIVVIVVIVGIVVIIVIVVIVVIVVS